jgi:hypothetical protein
LEENQPPTSLGVFKPVGSVVIALRSAVDQQALADALVAQGFAPDEIKPYSGAQMLAEIDLAVPQAGPLAQFGQELAIAKDRRVLAEQGFCFLVVPAPDAERTALVKDAVHRLRAPTAQHYGWLVIEELTDRTCAQVQWADPAAGVPP